jgi:predicted site-specific integrase-resolvase
MDFYKYIKEIKGKEMKLSEWAIKNSVCYKTAYRIFKKGLIVGAKQLPSGTIIVDEESSKSYKKEHNVVYARVSSSENKTNLDMQAKRVSDFCSAKGWVVNEIVKECASGLNDKRPKLQKILKDGKASRIIVEHKDRLTRFGFEYIKTLYDGEIIIINEVIEDESDLMQDFVSLVTSFCARLYGKRRTRRKTEEIIKQLSEND